MSDLEKRISLLEKDTAEIKGLRESRHKLNGLVQNHDNIIKELLKAPTNRDLQVMLLEMNGDIKLILSKQADSKDWQDSHQKADEVQFNALSDKIDKMAGYAKALSVVAGAIGAGFYVVVNYFTKRGIS